MKVYVYYMRGWFSYTPENFEKQIDRWEDTEALGLDEELHRELSARPNCIRGSATVDHAGELRVEAASPHVLFRPLVYEGHGHKGYEWAVEDAREILEDVQ